MIVSLVGRKSAALPGRKAGRVWGLLVEEGGERMADWRSTLLLCELSGIAVSTG
jgi:hypothetical protein